jgi:uncharacterized membrane protein
VSGEATLPCPACGGPNPAEAVFCGHCDKALGPFRYVREEIAAETAWHEALADRVTGFVGRPQFFVIHAMWFVLWALLNAGIITVVQRFDAYPYSLLGIILAVEAIFITGFLLISQNREKVTEEKFAELDYEVNVQSYRAIQETQALLREALARLDTIEGRLEARREEKP